jgi:5-methyltetrahydrofolate corrinoid/iron sulfur protein methyltransferase
MIAVSDNLNGLNPVLRDAMNTLDPTPIREIVYEIVRAGASMIDINPGYLSRHSEDKMRFLVEAVQAVTPSRLILDSPNPALIETGLHACNEAPIINSVSLEKRKLEGILPLAVKRNCDLVILLMDESSFSPAGVEEKISLALEISQRCLNAGLPLDKLIFDPVLPSLIWPDSWHRIGEAVKTIRLLSTGAVFGQPVRTMVGLSNLRSGFKRLHPVDIDLTVLAMLCGAGLEYAMVDVLEPRILQVIELANRIS